MQISYIRTMKILFVTWETYPIKSATSNCLMNIISELAKDKIEVGILNISGDVLLPKELFYSNIHFYNVFLSCYSSIKILYKNNILMACKEVIERFFRTLKKNEKTIVSKNTKKTVLNKLMQYGQEYDVLVAVCSHVINGIICDEYCKINNKKYILYQIDPIGTNLVYHNNDNMKKVELNLYKHAQCIITTPILAKEKEKDNVYSTIVNKIYAAEFPNVKNLVIDTDKHGSDCSIICFYSGRFYNGVRDCRYPLDVLKTINDSNLTLIFAGDGQEATINEYKNTYFGERLLHLGMISMAASFEMMQSSDVLINIGNNVTNQVPSKLFDYISTGKPIVNFCKSKECPTIPYINRYKFGINIIENEDTLERQAEKVSQFIKLHYKDRMSFDEIKKIFYENTPEYVGNYSLDC